MAAQLRGKLPYLLLIVAKLALVGSLPMTALPDFDYDEGLFVRLARQLAQGHWLGPYGPVTLAKGPGYPIFIAAAYHLGIPLGLAHQLLYILFCVLFAVALAPIIPAAWGRIFLFAVLLFNPLSCGVNAFAASNREGIYPALTGLVFACAIGMTVRYRERPATLYQWALGLGAALGYFWITREEGPWILPSLALLLFVTIIAILQNRPKDWPWRVVGYLMIPGGTCVAVVAAICAINRVEYGQFLVVEFKDPSFLAAYGALARVEPAEFQRFVPVAKETRARVYAVSPSFGKMRDYLEGSPGETWGKISSDTYPQLHGEIAGGWFMWAFREAVTAAGHGSDSKAGHEFLKQMAREINAACDDGRLRGGPRRDTMVPAWRWDYLRPMLEGAGRAALIISRFQMLREVHLPPSRGTPEARKEFGRMVGGNISGAAEDIEPSSLDGAVHLKLNVISWIYRAYQLIMLPWTFLAGIAFLVLTVTVLRGYRTWLWPVAAAMLGAMIMRMMLLAYINASSFPAINVLYLSCCHPLLLAVNVLMTIQAADVIRDRQARRNPLVIDAGCEPVR